MTPSLNPSETIARELEALGEEPLSADELAMLAGDELGDLDDEPAVASTARLIELSRPLDPVSLSEIDQQRVWRTIEKRRGPVTERPAAGESARRTWAPWIAVSIAIAAAAVMLVLLPADDREGPTGPSAAEVAEVGDRARSGLRALDDGLGDTARAERLSADYQRRLEATR